MFPHHENEVAIARAAAGTRLANVWMHCHPVRYDGSLGCDQIEDLTLDVLADQGWDNKTIRFWLLSAHYRKTLVLSKKSLEDTDSTLAKMNRCIEALIVVADGDACHGPKGKSDTGDMDQMVYDINQGLVTAMADDLKVSAMVSNLISSVKQINGLLSGNKVNVTGAGLLLNCFKEIDEVLNIFQFHKKKEYSDEAHTLIKEREAARQRKDWAKADEIRDRLDALGICVHDRKA